MIKLLLSLALMPALAFALVDMRNANYADEWTDLKAEGDKGFDLSVKRTYNSRTLFSGIFGFGQCSDYETKLEPTPEGTLKLNECGAGLEITYRPSSFNNAQLNAVIDETVKAMAKANGSMSPDYASKLKTDLRNDPDKRSEFARKYGVKTELKEGVKYVATNSETEFIQLQNNIYTRTLTSGLTQSFDLKGRLVKVKDKNNNFIDIVYQDNKILHITDNSQRKLSFTFKGNKVTKISGPNGIQATYQYTNNDTDLAAVTNAWGNTYVFKYNEGHNLTHIFYPDKTTKELTYDNDKDLVTSFKDRDNCKETYKHEVNKNNPKYHYWTNLEKVCDKKVVTKSKYEFWYAQRKDGSGEYLQRVRTDINKRVMDITYHEVFARPIVMIRDNIKSEFDYYSSGLLKSKKIGTELSLFTYDKSCNKVNSVVVGLQKSVFTYDKSCNISTATNNKGYKVSLAYDSTGKIISLQDQAKRLVRIGYDKRFGKPNFLERPGLGKINFTFKNNGEVDTVKSNEGPVVAVQVASAFNNLLEVVKPAGVELGI